jgi:hypothetical protein
MFANSGKKFELCKLELFPNSSSTPPLQPRLADAQRQQLQQQQHSQGCQVADLSAIFADFGLMEKLLAKWKNPIRLLPNVAESGLIESILTK